MFAGVVGSQLFYGLHVFPVVATLSGLVGADIALPATYLGWTPGVVGIIVGLLLTVSVSLVTAPGATEDRTAYAVSGVESD